MTENMTRICNNKHQFALNGERKYYQKILSSTEHTSVIRAHHNHSHSNNGALIWYTQLLVQFTHMVTVLSVFRLLKSAPNRKPTLQTFFYKSSAISIYVNKLSRDLGISLCNPKWHMIDVKLITSDSKILAVSIQIRWQPCVHIVWEAVCTIS